MGNLLEINKKNIKSISQKCSHILETELATYRIFGYLESAGISCSTLKNNQIWKKMKKSSKIDFWPFLKLQKMEFGQNFFCVID